MRSRATVPYLNQSARHLAGEIDETLQVIPNLIRTGRSVILIETGFPVVSLQARTRRCPGLSYPPELGYSTLLLPCVCDTLASPATNVAADEKQVFERSLQAARIDSPLRMLHQLGCRQVRHARGRASGSPGDAPDDSMSRRTRGAHSFGARR